VLGYRSIFSHDRVPFHLKPKHYHGGAYDDFSLGFFGDGADRVLASAELKGPEVDLDLPQRGRYGNLSPVSQAEKTARRTRGCRWVIVSNFRELRLYELRPTLRLLVRAQLTEIRDANALALLLAHFDQSALLGDNMKRPLIDIAAGEDAEHPSSILQPLDGYYRVVARFTPSIDQEFLAFEIEQKLRTAILRSPALMHFISPPDYQRTEALETVLRDGWTMVERKENTRRVRISMSMFGQIQVSAAFAAKQTQFDSATRAVVDGGHLVDTLRFLTDIAYDVYLPLAGKGGWSNVAEAPTQEGIEITRAVSAEIRDVRDAVLFDETFHNAGRWGIPEGDSVVSGDVPWRIGDEGPSRPAAWCVADLAVYFRGPGGGLLVDPMHLRGTVDSLSQGEKDRSLSVASRFGATGA